jgi:1-phosphatidylinositol-4-phosphate 5-kinase
MKNGQGNWKKTGDENSNQYTGAYLNDKKHGFGQFDWSTGSKYRGNYEIDLKKGFGEMTWVNGCIYRGYWD